MPGLFWLGGFRSDMRGSKATFIDALAERQGRAFMRFDYSGHGESEGDFAQGAIGVWAAEAFAVFCALTKGPQIVIGSSMGGWVALLLARALAQAGESHRLAGMALIAPAVDFTEDLMWPQIAGRRAPGDRGKRLLAAARRCLWRGLSADPPLFEDGRANRLFGGEIRSFCPVFILQGMEDPDVPWRHAMKLVEHLAADPVTVSLIKDGDHRLSRPQDLAALQKAIEVARPRFTHVNKTLTGKCFP